MIYIGLDDTDTIDSPGTGHLARLIAADLSEDHQVLGVLRHQLLDDPRVPCTAKNSCATVLLKPNGRWEPRALLKRVRVLVLENFVPGSDPGLCLTSETPVAIQSFGRRAKEQLVSQALARSLAAGNGIDLLGLGGSQDGIIGALAAVGLAAGGSDGRYVMVGRSRELEGLQPVAELLAAGIKAVKTLDGHPITKGLVQCDKLRPARRDHQPVAFVKWQNDHWLPLKLD
jgi:tRNA(Ile2) C34 agmatinyltransferase TiaS